MKDVSSAKDKEFEFIYQKDNQQNMDLLTIIRI